MKKKYYFSSILLALVKCAGFLMVWLMVQFAVTLIAGIVIGVLYYGASVDLMNSLIFSYTSEIMIITNALTIIIFMVFYKIIKVPLSEAVRLNNSGFNSYTSSAILGFLGQYATLFMVNLLLLTVLPMEWLDALTETNSAILTGNPVSAFVYSVIMAPVLEELLCRGLILSSLQKAMPKWPAIIISSLIFGVLHGNPLGIIYASAFGILLGWVYTKYNSLIPAIITHMAFNLTSNFMSDNFFNSTMIFIATPLLVAEIVLINKRQAKPDNKEQE